MDTSTSSRHQDGAALLKEMDKTISQKVAVCAAHMMLEEGSIVLDAGCANGMATAYFALKNPNAHVIGLDYDSDYIATAKKQFDHIENLEFIVADLTDFDLGERKLDAIVNLSILHEPYSYSGYRKQTVEDIIEAELKNLKPGGVIINRDFVLPDNPEKMVYLSLPDNGNGNDLKTMSMAEFFIRYSEEAKSFSNQNPKEHIKGFFYEEMTKNFSDINHPIPTGWRTFSVEHQFAWEFIWRMHYRERFQNESEEKYAFWTHQEHKSIPERLGARVTYSAHYENPWLMENWYAPHAKLFDQDMSPLPLPPSNFISVLEKITPTDSTILREHRVSKTSPSYLQISAYKNVETKEIFDMVKRPGDDIVNIVPYSMDEEELVIWAKADYPRPISNIKPRMMTPNLDHKQWSGHMIEALAAANTESPLQETIHTVLFERAGFSPDSIQIDTAGTLQYYPAPADLNERIASVHVEVKTPPKNNIKLSGGFSGFRNDGVCREFNAQNLLQALQVGMLADARLETSIYSLMQDKGILPKQWIGAQLNIKTERNLSISSMEEQVHKQRQYNVFKDTDARANWLDIHRSEFHEVALYDGCEHVMAKNELEFVVPAKGVSTNSITLACIARDDKTGEALIGVQKISSALSQFAAVQQRENHSGLLTLPSIRLPSAIDHIQKVPEWIAKETGASEHSIKNLGEAYFSSIGVMPNRVFPFVVSEVSPFFHDKCDFIPLRDAFQNYTSLEDFNLLNAVFRATHALNLWPDYTEHQPGPIKL